MKKVITLFVTMSLLSMTANAQDYYHGVGAKIVYGMYRLNYTSSTIDYQGTNSAAVPALFYKASLDFSISRSTGFTISAYPFVGLAMNLNSTSGASGSFGAGIPILGEIHFGDLDDACFFIGGGFSAAYLATIGFGSGSIVGPQLGLGGQLNLRNKLIGVRCGYTYGLNKTKTTDPDINISLDRRSMLSFSFYYPLGQ